jgi:hypothetical protein
LLPTDKPSRLTIRLKTNELMYSYKEFVNQKYEDISLNQNQHIYITSDEERKEGDLILPSEADLFFNQDPIIKIKLEKNYE